MPNVAIMTDSNSGLTPEQGNRMGVSVLPMPVIIDGETYFENVNIFPEEFYERQAADAQVSSSQPSPEQLMSMWETLLQKYDEVVYIPMSASLSSSCESADMFAREFEGRVHVVNNYRISVTQLQSVQDAVILAGQGMNGTQIKDILEKEAMDATIYICVDTLKYLKKGGRITPAVAAIGTVLNIKPVMTIQGGKLEALTKARGNRAAFRAMCRALREDLDTRLKPLCEQGELVLGMAHTQMEPHELDHWREELHKAFPGEEILESPLMLSIGCHTGPGALGIGAVRRHRKDMGAAE